VRVVGLGALKTSYWKRIASSILGLTVSGGGWDQEGDKQHAIRFSGSLGSISELRRRINRSPPAKVS
jgi:hypothetical protein